MPRHSCLDSPNVMSLIAEVALLEGKRLLRQRRRRKSPVPTVSPGQWAPPDSQRCLAAAKFCTLHSSPALAGHCARTYAFGMALSTTLGLTPDRELLYIASLLHDLGLTEAHAGEGPFELRGAEAAYAWCREHNVAQNDAELVHEAIRLHTSLVAARREPEVALVHLGAGVDVIGYHFEDIHTETIRAIVELWPRQGFKRELYGLLQDEARRTPDSPMGVQWGLGFGKRVLAAPFAE